MKTEKKIKSYKVSFSDGTVERVHGCWAAHAWAVAAQLWPDKEIRNLQLLEADPTVH